MAYVLQNLRKSLLIFLSMKREIIEICKFPKLDSGKQKEVCTSLLSEIGMLFLSVVGKQESPTRITKDLEYTFWTYKAETGPLGRAANVFYMIYVTFSYLIFKYCF